MTKEAGHGAASGGVDCFVALLLAMAISKRRRLTYSAACCATVGIVPATVARRMSRGCDGS
jgi:hypothetical protein